MTACEKPTQKKKGKGKGKGKERQQSQERQEEGCTLTWLARTSGIMHACTHMELDVLSSSVLPRFSRFIACCASAALRLAFARE